MKNEKTTKKWITIFMVIAIALAIILFMIWLSSQNASSGKALRPSGPAGIEIEKSISIVVARDLTAMSCRMLSKQIITVICDGLSVPRNEVLLNATREGWIFHRDTVSPMYFKAVYYGRGSDVLVLEWDKGEIVRSVAIIRNL